jgi:hypothetical protein
VRSVNRGAMFRRENRPRAASAQRNGEEPEEGEAE